MNRRTLIKQLTMATAAAMLIPSCVAESKKVSIALNNLDVNGEEEELLAAIADTFIPATDKPGAKAVDETCKSVNGKTFTDSNAEERLALLQNIDKNEKSFSDDINIFYGGMRYLVIQGYTGSQYFLTEVKPYQLVPGPNFKGCVPVSSTPKTA